jgi:hypothetical protein
MRRGVEAGSAPARLALTNAGASAPVPVVVQVVAAWPALMPPRGNTPASNAGIASIRHRLIALLSSYVFVRLEEIRTSQSSSRWRCDLTIGSPPYIAPKARY